MASKDLVAGNKTQNLRTERLFAKKFTSETEGGKAARSYQENWTWISTLVKQLCNHWSFQTKLFLLEGTKLEIEALMKFSQSKWMSELDASFCWRGFRKTRRIIRKTYGENTVYFSKNEFTSSFLRTASTNDTDHTYILVRETRALSYFQQFWPPGFSSLKMIENIWQFN